MAGFVSFFESIGSWFGFFGEMVVNFIASCKQVYSIAITAVAIPPLLQAYLPQLFGACIYAVVLLGVVKFIFGR